MHVRRAALAGLALCLATPAVVAPTVATAAEEPGIFRTDLDHTGDGYPVYRIPALTTSTEGTLLAAYDGRPNYGDVPNNIALVLRRSTDNGTTWQDRQVVRYEPGKPGFGDPSLVTDRQTGRIWLFHAASINQGYFGSSTGNDDSDPNVLHADVSWSDDDGLTWEHRRLTSEVKDPRWAGLFAASGEGIQITRGPHRGRLVQQYAVRYQGGNWAASLISDDHGETWRFGKLLGPGMDENKVVELSDGRLMLNSRAAGGYRKVAFSNDGGETWSGLHADDELIDPQNNGSIIRYDAEAAPSSPDASKLLFSNTATQSGRRNLTIRQSCDNGVTWPIRKVVEPGAAEYSTLTPLGDGQFGLLYERGGYQHISFARFGDDWIDGVCAPVTSRTQAPGEPGGTAEVEVTVTSQETGAIDGGRVVLDLPPGFTAPEVPVAKLERGAKATVRVPVQVPEGVATNAYPYTVTFVSDKGSSHGSGSIVVKGGNLVLSDTTQRSYDGATITDLTDQVDAVKDLTGGAVTVRFSTTSRPAVGTLLSLADPISAVRDVIVSLNGGRPYVEVRTATSVYPVRLQSNVDVADGQVHELIAASNAGVTSLILDGDVIAQASGQGFFADVTALTRPHTLNPSGKPNLTLGMNRGHFSVNGGPAAPNNRWGFVGTIHGVEVSNDLRSGEELVPASGISIASVSSEETLGEDGRAVNAVDGNPATIWHSRWTGTPAQYPHQITLDLGEEQPLTALRYLRRAVGTNGDIADYAVSVSRDNTSWTQVATGRFASSKGEEEVRFAPHSARYVRLEALSAVNGLDFAAAAELRPVRTR
ncbi:exo-alpha-sialidase [Intrasporangium sp. DVR]|uniref:exo-alpha-sialidase n=1 Tax=Intrasporangium sp. DVR TaxID=3127867 RepID=UPI00313A5007